MNKNYRELLKGLPKQQLSFLPTPLQRLDRLSDSLGVELYMKRDDMTGISQFGGNKIRKLEYLLGDAAAKNCDTVFTYGATQSNHAMETATACRRMGLTPILYLTAVVEPDEHDPRANLLLDELLGAEIHIVRMRDGETEDEADERACALAREQMSCLEAEGHHCYNIPMGGANAIGSLGFVEGWLEMMEQADTMGISPDYVFHATGTGGTLAGLAAGRALTKEQKQSASEPRSRLVHENDSESKQCQIISIAVSRKDQNYLKKVADIANETLASISKIHPEADLCSAVKWDQDLCCDNGYYSPGYEMPNDAASEAIRLLARSEGILTDPVYTGKAFAGMLDYIRKGRVPQGSTIVFWHTGGNTALFSEHEILGDSLL